MNIKVELNPAFKEVNRSKRRYIVMKGSAGSGKSVDTATNYILRLLQDPGRNLLCVRKSDITNRDSTFAELQGAIFRMFGDKYEKYWTIKQNPLMIECKANCNQIIFRGVNDDKQREKLKSITFKRGKLTDVWIEEATELMQSDFEIIDDRLRGKLPPGQFYQIKMTFNPVSATHWIKKNFFDIEDENVLTHSSNYVNNRFIDAAYRARMERRKKVDPEGYRVYGLGEWGEVGGLMARAAYGLNDTVDSLLAGIMVAGAAGAIGSDESPFVPTKDDAYDLLVDLGTELTEKNVPLLGRWVVVPPFYHGLLQKDSRFVGNGTDVNMAILQGGHIGAAAGFQIYVSNNVPNTDGAKYKILAGTNAGASFAEQITETEGYRPESNFSDAVKGLHLCGVKVLQKNALATLTVNRK